MPGSGAHDLDAGFGGFSNLLVAVENRNTYESPSGQFDDYGDHRTRAYKTPDFIQNDLSDWLDRTELFHAVGATDDYGYLWVDRTRSMESTLSNDTSSTGVATKISAADRAFLIFPPATPGTDPLRMVVSDRMTTLDTKYEKRWTLYYSGVPSVNGTPSAGPSRGNPASTANKTTYAGASLITATQTAGGIDNKTWVTPLFPTAFSVVSVAFRQPGTIEDAYGLPVLASGYGTDHAAYVSTYRTETIPTTPALTDQFVTALEVTASTGSQSTTTAVSGTHFKGARIGDRIGAFTDTPGRTSGTLTIPAAGSYRVALAGVPVSANRTVTGDGNVSSITAVTGGGSSPFTSSAQGVLYLAVTTTGANAVVTMS